MTDDIDIRYDFVDPGRALRETNLSPAAEIRWWRATVENSGALACGTVTVWARAFL